MTKEEIQKLAKKITTKDLIHLACFHLKYLDADEFGGTFYFDNEYFEITVKKTKLKCNKV